VDRINKFTKLIKTQKLDGFIVTNPINIYYLTGFRGVSPTERETLLVFNPRPTLITARLYQNEASKLKSDNLSVIIVDERKKIIDSIRDLLRVGLPAEALRSEFSGSKTSAKVGFEEHNLTYSEFNEFKKGLKELKLIPIKHLVEDLRSIKSGDEINNIEKAQKISQSAFAQIIKLIKPGQTEAELAEKLASIIKNLGAQSLAFESIIASGPNSALPHYVTGRRKIKKGEVLLFDFGAKYKNYSADLSRTVFVGIASDKYKNIYRHVNRVQKKAIESITHDLKASEAFHLANNLFKKHNLHQNFIHSLGHGIGLQVHEKPHLGKKSKERLKEGMVFSVEPGLYFAGWGGVRIEDLVVIKNGRAKLIGKPAKFNQI